MSDQMRWFKLWYSALGDDALLQLDPAMRWAWAALGAYTKVHGENGILKLHPNNPFLAAAMGVEPPAVLGVIASLPHVFLASAPIRWPHGHQKPWKCDGEVWGEQVGSMRGSDPLDVWGRRYGAVFVTWRNWPKYQQDTTASSRGYALRSKRRGEESSKRRGIAPAKRELPDNGEIYRPGMTSGEFADAREAHYQASPEGQAAARQLANLRADLAAGRKPKMLGPNDPSPLAAIDAAKRTTTPDKPA